MSKQLEHIHELLDALDSMCVQADEDCPAEYRTKHFTHALERSYDLLEDLTKVYLARRSCTNTEEQSNDADKQS